MNILLLTSVYPSLDDKDENVTKVVQYFAQVWCSQGHCVKVIHNAHKYPSFVHLIPRPIKKKLATKLNFYIPDLKNVRDKVFFDGNVQVFRFPLLKLVPHGDHSKKSIEKQAKRIQNALDELSFVPDVIMGHWMSPQIQIISSLKNVYNCRTSLVLHGRGYIGGGNFNCKPYLPFIDKLGCRSQTESEYVQQVLGLKEKPFVCYSGVPDSFVAQQSFNLEKFLTQPDVWKLIFVGRLVEYKQIDKILIALSKIDNKNFIFDVIGDGPEKSNLTELAYKLGLKDKVVFHGRMERGSVLKYMNNSHIFVMISENEVFGLVYLEAMAASCITIGSQKGGIDGVIEDGKNGILCQQGNADSLEAVFSKVFEMDPVSLQNLSRNGFETAKSFTDSNVAERYLKEVMDN